MLRFVRSPIDGEVVADLRCELPGRGVWIGNRRKLVSEAVARKLFARGFREACNVPPDLDTRVADRLVQAALTYLSLARKAGEAVTGFEKVDVLIAGGRVQVLIGASDGSEDGRSKLKQRLAAHESDAAVIEMFTSDQLGLAFGRTNVIHAAVTIGGLAGKFVMAARRAAEYCASVGESALEYEEKA